MVDGGKSSFGMTLTSFLRKRGKIWTKPFRVAAEDAQEHHDSATPPSHCATLEDIVLIAEEDSPPPRPASSREQKPSAMRERFNRLLRGTASGAEEATTAPECDDDLEKPEARKEGSAPKKHTDSPPSGRRKRSFLRREASEKRKICVTNKDGSVDNLGATGGSANGDRASREEKEQKEVASACAPMKDSNADVSAPPPPSLLSGCRRHSKRLQCFRSAFTYLLPLSSFRAHAAGRQQLQLRSLSDRDHVQLHEGAEIFICDHRGTTTKLTFVPQDRGVDDAAEATAPIVTVPAGIPADEASAAAGSAATAAGEPSPNKFRNAWRSLPRFGKSRGGESVSRGVNELAEKFQSSPRPPRWRRRESWPSWKRRSRSENTPQLSLDAEVVSTEKNDRWQGVSEISLRACYATVQARKVLNDEDKADWLIELLHLPPDDSSICAAVHAQIVPVCLALLRKAARAAELTNQAHSLKGDARLSNRHEAKGSSSQDGGSDCDRFPPDLIAMMVLDRICRTHEGASAFSANAGPHVVARRIRTLINSNYHHGNTAGSEAAERKEAAAQPSLTNHETELLIHAFSIVESSIASCDSAGHGWVVSGLPAQLTSTLCSLGDSQPLKSNSKLHRVLFGALNQLITNTCLPASCADELIPPVQRGLHITEDSVAQERAHEALAVLQAHATETDQLGAETASHVEVLTASSPDASPHDTEAVQSQQASSSRPAGCNDARSKEPSSTSESSSSSSGNRSVESLPAAPVAADFVAPPCLIAGRAVISTIPITCVIPSQSLPDVVPELDLRSDEVVVPGANELRPPIGRQHSWRRAKRRRRRRN